MNVNYDVTTDSMYISFNGETSIESEEMAEGLILDYNHQGKVVGLDIQHASQHASSFTQAMGTTPQALRTY